MLSALLLTAQLLSSLQSDDASATVGRPPPAQEPAPAPAPAPAPVRSVAPPAADPEGAAAPRAGPTTRLKSTNLLVAGGGFVIGALAAYLALAGGVAVNFSKGGLSDPIDADDALLLLVLPATGAAAFSWLVGLFDHSQRSVVGSVLWAVLGAGVGELAGIGAGVLVGKAAFAKDPGLRGVTMVAVAPAFAALGAVVFMELFKPGEEAEGAYASISVARDQSGRLAFGPALGFQF